MSYFATDPLTLLCYHHPAAWTRFSDVTPIHESVGGALTGHPVADTIYGLSILGFFVLSIVVGVLWEVRQGGKW